MAATALITGAARGIGYGIAQALAAEGFDLVINDIAPEADVREPLAALDAQGGGVHYVRADVSDPEDRRRMIDTIADEVGAVHVLVNNAGVAPQERRDILEATEASFERVMKINLQGPYFLTQAVARMMIDDPDPEEGGPARCIINIASSNAELASTNRGEYCISKAGVSMATRLWALRLAEFGIPVYEIRPGIIATPMTAPVKDHYDAFIAEGGVPQRRWGQPEDVGDAVAMLARGTLAYSTGQVVRVDGGLMLQAL
ncbi:MAG: 3-ketoacyl-ACP reductase [Bacteroidetes bacterium]|jgi:NAD(P)-dependent dehydrogenase (short-subunit alcohol dehydrogenase family)|nr:3-ketoacyl-ACP reductase [Bacteroidota bacterium]